MESAEKTRSLRLARLLIEVLEEHVRDALSQNVPRSVYVQAVAEHAAHVYDLEKTKKS